MSTLAEQTKQKNLALEDAYKAFYDFYVLELKRDDSRYSKYRLQLSTVYFETYLEQTKTTYPALQATTCNLDEKKAIARAALYDALVTHTFSEFLGSAAAQVNARMDLLEKDVIDLTDKANKRTK